MSETSQGSPCPACGVDIRKVREEAKNEVAKFEFKQGYETGIIEGRRRAVEYIKEHVDEMENDQSFNEVLEAASKEK